MSNHICDVKWYSGRSTVGIVLVRKDAKYRAYIGAADGHDEQEDALAIRNWGAKFDGGPALWPEIPADEWSTR